MDVGSIVGMNDDGDLVKSGVPTGRSLGGVSEGGFDIILVVGVIVGTVASIVVGPIVETDAGFNVELVQEIGGSELRAHIPF